MFKTTTKVFVIAFLLFASISSYAQPENREIVNQGLQWFSLASNMKMNKLMTVYVEGQFRYADDFDPMQYQARTSLDFNLNKHWVISPGYVYTWNPLYGKQPLKAVNNEHRIYGQLIYKHKISSISISHRIRYEHRMIQQGGPGSDYDKVQERGRYRFMATMPFKGEKIEPKSYFAGVYDEVFVSWGGPVTFNKPDQNRIFAGIGYQFNSRFNILGGFLYQMLIKSNGAKQENNVGVQVMATYNLDFTKKE